MICLQMRSVIRGGKLSPIVSRMRPSDTSFPSMVKEVWIGSNRLDYKPFIQREYSALIRMQLIIRTCILKILCQSAGRFIPVHPFISADKTFHQSFLTGFLVFNPGTGQESTTFFTIKRSIRLCNLLIPFLSCEAPCILLP